MSTTGALMLTTIAVVLCSPIVREYLINYARSLIYTTALGLPTLAMIVSAYRLMRRGTTLQVSSFPCSSFVTTTSSNGLLKSNDSHRKHSGS